jgi:hypothetical protein
MPSLPLLRRFLLALPGIVLAAALVSACGARADLQDPDQLIAPDGGLPDGVQPPPNTCGNGTCDSTENCGNCPKDCGFCKTCGDGTCDNGESCVGCPQDCGACPSCGNGFCDATEDCTICPQDCGKCAACGDGTCQTNESCNNCPDDCGKCVGCGDGLCGSTETCISCPHDCGVCSFCGNNKCETYETCSNCPQDCGQCTTLSCFQAFTCAIKCIQLNSNPPSVSVSCVANCLAEGCPDTQFFFDQAFNCAIVQAFGGCGGDFNCIQQACATEIAACLGSTCP